MQFYRLFDNPFFVIFTIIVVLDLILDLIKPWYFKRANGMNYIVRDGITYLAWTLIYPWLIVAGLGDIADIFLIAFIYQYAVFLIESYTELGWWLPDGLRKFIEAKMNDPFKKKGDK